MNTAIWLLGGAAAGWAACSVLDLHAGRALTISAILGVVGALFGGEAVPLYGGGVHEAIVRGPFAVLVVSVFSIASLKLTRVFYGRLQQSRS